MSVCTCVPGVPCAVHPAMTQPDAEPTTQKDTQLSSSQPSDTPEAESNKAATTKADAEPTNKEERRFWDEMLEKAPNWWLSNTNARRLIAQVAALEARAAKEGCPVCPHCLYKRARQPHD